MHHAYVRCNYSPYSTFWDKVFDTFKAHEVKAYMLVDETAVDVADPPNATSTSSSI